MTGPVHPGGWRERVLFPLVLATVSMVGPFSIDMAFPAFAHIQHDLGVGVEQTQLLVSAYLLSFGLMSIVHGPLSDALGRKPVMIAGMLGYVVSSIGCALAPTMEVLLVCRAGQGLLAGGGVIVSRTLVRDIYEGPQAQRLMSRVTMIFAVAPALAPIVGGWVLQLGPWRWIFWFLALFGALVVALIALVLPETHAPQRRTPFRPSAMLAGLVQVGRSGPFLRVAGSAAFAFAGQFLYIGSAAILIVDLLHQGETDFWMFFVPMIAGIMGGSWVSGWAAGRVEPHRLVLAGYSFALASALVNVALMAVPATAGLPAAVLGPMFLALGVAVAYPTTQLAVLDSFPAQRGAAASLSTAAALLLNGIIAGALAPRLAGSLLGLALGAAALVSIGLGLWVWHVRALRAATLARSGDASA